jgi:hypothetical protein
MEGRVLTKAQLSIPNTAVKRVRNPNRPGEMIGLRKGLVRLTNEDLR